jgi:hypothetical protein
MVWHRRGHRHLYTSDEIDPNAYSNFKLRPMTIPPTRAILLYQHGRYADAEQELRRALAEAPQDFMAHAL